MLEAQKLTEAELHKTWDTYFETNSLDSRNALVVHYTASLVRGVVHRVASHLPVERDELVSYGVMGLIDAISKFDSTKKVKFETYAATRIRGQILDEIRSLDWAPRTMRARARAIDAAEDELAVDLGRAPSSVELAEHLGISMDDLHQVKTQVNASSVSSLDYDNGSGGEYGLSSVGYRIADPAASPASHFENTEIVTLLAGAIDRLPKRSRIIVALYYLHGMTLSEIGKILGVTESRVCQLQSRLLKSLQECLAGEPVAA